MFLRGGGGWGGIIRTFDGVLTERDGKSCRRWRAKLCPFCWVLPQSPPCRTRHPSDRFDRWAHFHVYWLKLCTYVLTRVPFLRTPASLCIGIACVRCRFSQRTRLRGRGRQRTGPRSMRNGRYGVLSCWALRSPCVSLCKGCVCKAHDCPTRNMFGYLLSSKSAACVAIFFSCKVLYLCLFSIHCTAT